MSIQKILLVDDKIDLLTSGSALFKNAGYDVFVALNGSEALAQLPLHEFAIIITDIVMPEMDGYSLCYAIRAGQCQQEVPIIMYSASFIRDHHQQYAYEVGADLFISKKEGNELLLQAAEKVLSRGRQSAIRIDDRLSAQDVSKRFTTWLIAKMESRNGLFSAAKDELLKHEGRFKALVENSYDLISMIDEEGRVIYQSPVAKRMLGYDNDEAIGLPALNFFHPDDQADVIARIKQVKEQPGIPVFRSNRMRHKDGHYIWTEGTTTNLLADPNVGAIVGNFREITDWKNAMDALKHNEQRLEAERSRISDLFEQAPSYICILAGPDHVYEMANPLYLQITGKKDIIGKTAVEVFPELIEQGFVALLDQIYNTGIPFSANEVFISIKNDETGEMVGHYMNFVYQPYRDSEGNVEGVFFFANLVTEQVLARRKIEQKEKYFRALVENAADIISLADSKGNLTYVSPSFEKVTGYTSSDIIGKSYTSFIHPDYVEESKSFFREILANPGVSVRRSGCFIHKDGSHIWLEGASINLINDENVGGVVSNLRDFTLRRQADEKIAHVSRLYSFLSHINQSIVHIDQREQLFEEACDVAYHIGKFKMAWIGILNKDVSTVDLVKGRGVPEEDLPLFSNAKYRDEGGVGYMVRTKTPFVCNLIEQHEGMKPWSRYAILRGLKSMMILPLRLNGEIIATFNLYADEQDFFDKQEIELLEEVANDISFALGVFEKEKLRKQMEAKLLHNELRFKQAQAIAHVGSWELDLQSNMFTWAEETCKIYGLPPDQNIFSYTVWLEFLHPDDKEEVLRKISTGMSALTSIAFNHRIVRKDGSIRHIFSEAHFDVNEYGVPIGLYGVGHDVTKAKEAEEKIINANRLYAFISQVNQTIVQVTNEEELFQAACKIAIEQGGFALAWISLPDMESRHLNVVAHCNANDSDIELLTATRFDDDGPIATVMTTGQMFVINDFQSGEVANGFKTYASIRGYRSCIVLPIRKGGKIIGAYNLVSVQPNLFDEEEIRLLNEITNDLSFALDVFEKEKHRKEMEDKVLKSESSLKRAQELAHFGSWDIDFISGKVTWSEETCRIYGIPVEERYMQSFESWIAHIHEDDVAEILKVTKESETTLAPCRFYHKIVRDNGDVRHVFSEAHYDIGKDGRPVGLRGVVHDISEAKEARESLARSEENLRMIMDIIPQSICAKNYDGRYVFVNKSYAKLYDTLPESIIGKNLKEVLFSENNIERILAENKEIISSGQLMMIPNDEFFDNNGNRKLFYTIKVPFTVAGTNEKAILSVSLDITEQKAAEFERSKIISDIVQRNKDLEQFSYIVSHNLRSPVANIMGLTDVLTDIDLDEETKKGLIGDLSVSTKKLDRVISDLNFILQVKHTESKQKEHVRLSEILRDIQLSVDNLIKSNDVQIHSDFGAVDELFTLKSYLYSILYNLVSNSIKYRQPDVPPVLEITSSFNGNRVFLCFKDNGLGIDMTKRKDEVFGLYKRFHSHVSGKGMGLFMVKTQVESLGGTIAIESEVNKGATFTIEFDVN